MFKIGEFSKLTQVSIRMLRFYDEQGLLKPAHVDEATGYRYYSASQIPQLNRIVFLRDLGFSGVEMEKALADWREESIDSFLDAKRAEIEEAIERECKKLSKIELAKRDLFQDGLDMNCNVCIKAVPGVTVLSLRRVVADYYQEGALWKEMTAFVQREGITPNEEAFTIYQDPDYREQDVDIELCMPCDYDEDLSFPDGFSVRFVEPVPYMASLMLKGSFECIAGVFRSFADWLQQHNQYEMAGTSRQIVHRGPWNEDDPSNYVIELQIPLNLKLDPHIM